MKTLIISKTFLDHKLMEWSGIFILFLYIYSPTFKFLPVNTSYIIILLAIAYASIGNNLSRFLGILQHKSFVTFLFFYIFSLIYTILIPVFTKEVFESTFLFTYFRLLFDILLVIPFFILLFRYELDYSTKDFLNVLVKIGVIQGVIAAAMFIIPGMRDFVFSYIMEAPSDKLIHELYRGYGLANDFYFPVPLFQALIFIVNSILFIYTSKKKYLFYYPFILLSMVMNARITLVVIPIFFLVIFTLSLYYDDLKWLRKLSTLFLILTVLILGIIIYFIFNPEKAASILWIIEGVSGGLGALTGNLSESKTLSTIAYEHFHFPHRSFEIWFGKGLNVFDNPKSYVRSDLGYIRYIYYGGIVLSVLFYFSIINFSINRILKSPHVLIKVLLLSLLITTFVVHFKGNIFNSSAYFKGFLLILILTLYEPKTSLDTK